MQLSKCPALPRRYVTLLQYALLVALLVLCLDPWRKGQARYEHLTRQEALRALVPGVCGNLTAAGPGACDYTSVLFNNTLMEEPWQTLPQSLAANPPLDEGGEYFPKDCKPKYSVAVIVPYRDRPEQLYTFLMHMHNFLRKQSIHYRIYVVEQIDQKPFNRAKLLNVGATRAARAGFPCLVLHDVDLLPLHSANLYACTRNPRHLSASIHKFRYTLPYPTLFGGAVSILASQYTSVNGMSNIYFGWGGEDDDFSARLRDKGLAVCRLEPEVSRYFMLTHRQQPKSAKRMKLLYAALDRAAHDGINSLKYKHISKVKHPLFTHLLVDLSAD